jgi:uncharacterized integral membrane protein
MDEITRERLMSKSNSTPEKSKKTKGVIKGVVTFLGFKGIVSIIFLILVIIFSFQNIESTSIQFLFWKILEVSKLYLIVISILLGLIIGFALGFYFKKVNGGTN